MPELLTLTIGLLFPYLVLSLLGTLTTEFISRVALLRTKTLDNAIRTMFADHRGTGLAREFYAHHLVRSLFQGRRPPPYISGSTFAAVVMDLLRRRSGDGNVFATPVAEELKPLHEALRALVPHRPSEEEVQESLARWSADVMDRTSGQYQQLAQSIIVMFAIAVSAGLNVDTILLSEHLNRGAVLRQVFVASASELVKSPTPSAAGRIAEEDARRLADTWYRLQPFGLPIGWYARTASRWGTSGHKHVAG